MIRGLHGVYNSTSTTTCVYIYVFIHNINDSVAYGCVCIITMSVKVDDTVITVRGSLARELMIRRRGRTGGRSGENIRSQWRVRGRRKALFRSF